MAAPPPDPDERPTASTEKPFDDTRADFVIISSDNTAFYVYSALLSLVSPVFEVMFKLPQGVEQERYEGKPFVKVTDEAEKLHLLLIWCDPRCSTRPLDQPQTILEIADKYGMEDVMQLVNSSLLDARHHIEVDPLRIFAIAVRFRLKDLAEEAAAEAIKVPLRSWKRCEEMRHISAFSYDSLIDYRTRCCSAAREVIAELEWFRTNDMNDCRYALTVPCDKRTEGEESECRMRCQPNFKWVAWFMVYINQVDEALQQQIDGSVAVSLPLLSLVLLDISRASCRMCPIQGPFTLLDVAPIISRKINRRIANVPCNLEF